MFAAYQNEIYARGAEGAQPSLPVSMEALEAAAAVVLSPEAYGYIAVAGQVPVLFDGGIWRGADMFKALALGAVAVLLGRPYLWGLALEG